MDLAGVSELVLDLLGDVPGDHLTLDVVDGVRLHPDPDLASGPYEDLLDALMAALGDLLQPLQPLDVRLQRLDATLATRAESLNSGSQAT
jgi:hypothetical protein